MEGLWEPRVCKNPDSARAQGLQRVCRIEGLWEPRVCRNQVFAGTQGLWELRVCRCSKSAGVCVQHQRQATIGGSYFYSL